MTGADNQQERLSVASIPSQLGNYLAGFALGEASFMIVCRPRGDYSRCWKLSAAFNVSQTDRAPLDLFRETLACGTMRKAGNGGWYWEVNRLSEIRSRIIPFFQQFPLVGSKAHDFALFAQAADLLAKEAMPDADNMQILLLREQMNRGGKRRYTMERILRDYTPSSPADLAGEMR
ncbi:MAG TPA: LAGLIDADG family homing endonuclease [Solirubrobacteraceae bacterium]